MAIPRASKPRAARRNFEHRQAFRAKIKWRTGSEGRINHLKRNYGWNRTELTAITGARTWCGHGVSPTTSSRSAPGGMKPITPVPPARTHPERNASHTVNPFSGRSS